MWCINQGVLHTTNNGFDKDENPIIRFLEFLEDVAQAGNQDYFIKLTNEMLKDDDVKALLCRRGRGAEQIAVSR